MQISMDYHEDNPPYTVSANVWCEEINTYIEHWDGGTYDNYDDAEKKWDAWWPPMEEVRQACRDFDEELGFRSRYELEIGLWDVVGNDHGFVNQTVEY